ncbi:MAG: hypothetical protein SLAVMIC_00817 [uncultured marine phage]|uniref:Uncharacterized protein n=1 Tax=uncultured marine phage TaxID=707152 RepID=A0A8D9CDP8_9VIRU|nr:MAG: hypothetical protein SLAVMIC_00817 [uncultured marine phage]
MIKSEKEQIDEIVGKLGGKSWQYDSSSILDSSLISMMGGSESVYSNEEYYKSLDNGKTRVVLAMVFEEDDKGVSINNKKIKIRL